MLILIFSYGGGVATYDYVVSYSLPGKLVRLQNSLVKAGCKTARLGEPARFTEPAAPCEQALREKFLKLYGDEK